METQQKQYKGFTVTFHLTGWYSWNGYKSDTYEGMQRFINEQKVEFYRSPTKNEIKFGEGAIHYKSWKVGELSLRKDGLLQVRKKCPIDGLIYTRK